MKLEIAKENDKAAAFAVIEEYLKALGIPVAARNSSKPWGGYFVIEESATQKFIEEFFDDVPLAAVKRTEKLSPKILLVEKGKRLSWQYHHRRAEIWKVIAGNVQVVISEDDNQNPPIKKELNEIIILDKGQRHRLVGTDNWGVIAEIWQHTDDSHPSDEEDIVRVEDDFGR